MLLKRYLLTAICCMALVFSACSTKEADVVIAKYDNSDVTLKEFQKVYAKNAGNEDAIKTDSVYKLKNFLDLYVNFKMKLKDAEEKGYNKDVNLNNELLDYKKKVGVSFLLERNIVDPGVKNLYDRRKYELRISHIMIRVDSTGEEAALKRANAVLDSIKKGAKFEDMAAKYSQDFYSKPIGGDIYYITAGILPGNFEDAAYSTNPGEVYPSVIKTKFGYHIIKVTEKHERIPSIRASHILVGFYDSKGNLDSAKALAKIDSVKMLLEKGESFEKLAQKYSEDPGTKNQGGDIGFFERRMMVKEFDEAAFKMKLNEISEPIKTTYGYHIIKLTDIKKNGTLDEQKEDLKKIYKGVKYQDDYDNYVNNLKKKYTYAVDLKNINDVVKASDSIRFAGDHPRFNEIKDKVLFTYNDNKVNAGTVLTLLKDNPEYAGKFISYENLSKGVQKTGEDMLLEQEASTLDLTNEEFADLMQDYRNGIYIFKIQEEEVWNKMVQDSVKMVNLYESTKNNYVWPDRVSYQELFTKSDSLANAYYKMYQKGTSFDTLVVKHTERAGAKEKAGKFELTEIKSSQVATAAFKLSSPGEVSAPVKVNGGYVIVKLLQKDPSHIKSYEEAKPEVSGVYQDQESKRLEEAYNESLKTKYKPVFFYDKLEPVLSAKTK